MWPQLRAPRAGVRSAARRRTGRTPGNGRVGSRLIWRGRGRQLQVLKQGLQLGTAPGW